ncbi:EF-P lysine aminoacylase EpmA [Acidiphilium sp.]|uniref:EF-P lysine aminoacylase EpmA n=1 Tax=Acidiphilium sp. TaxID=527 RepID=UPI003D0408AD
MVAQATQVPSWSPERFAARLPYLRRRALLTQATRAFFTARNYLEVETPYAVTTPGEEVHLNAFRTSRTMPDGVTDPLWLHTSPEFAMKKLLAAGAGCIVQLARVWRNGEGSATHACEFTMLEWYRPHATLNDLINETMAFLRAVLPPTVTCRGTTTSLERAETITVAEAFDRHLHLDILSSVNDAPRLAAAANTALRERETWEDLFFRLMLGHIEPHLGRAQPTFLTGWPAPLAALARRDPADHRVAERFELYVCGIELANAFIELTDPAEQQARFEADRARRHEIIGSTDWPLDHDLIDAIALMPPSGGIALGFDRLAMIATAAPRITDVLWL